MMIKISALALSVSVSSGTAASAGSPPDEVKVFSPLLMKSKAHFMDEDFSAACDCDVGSCHAVEINDGAFLSQGSISISVGESGGGVEELHFDRAVHPNGQMYSNEGGASAWLMRSNATGWLRGHVWEQDGTKYELRHCKAMEAQVLSRSSHEPLSRSSRVDGEQHSFMMQVIENPEFRKDMQRKARTRAPRSGTVYPTVRWIYSAAAENDVTNSGYDSMEDVVDAIVSFVNIVLAISEVDVQLRTFCIEPWYAFDDSRDNAEYFGDMHEYLNAKYPGGARNKDADFFHFLFYTGPHGGQGQLPGRIGWSQWRWFDLIVHELGHNFGLGHNLFKASNGYGTVIGYSRPCGTDRQFFTNPSVSKPWGPGGSQVRLGNDIDGYNSNCSFEANPGGNAATWCTRGNDAQFLNDERFGYDDHGSEQNQCVWPCGVGTYGSAKPNCQPCPGGRNVLRYNVIPSLAEPTCGVGACADGWVPNARKDGCIDASAPTSEPTFEPTSTPTSEPTFKPTFEPTSTPTSDPTFEPTSMPTSEPCESRPFVADYGTGCKILACQPGYALLTGTNECKATETSCYGLAGYEITAGGECKKCQRPFAVSFTNQPGDACVVAECEKGHEVRPSDRRACNSVIDIDLSMCSNDYEAEGVCKGVWPSRVMDHPYWNPGPGAGDVEVRFPPGRFAVYRGLPVLNERGRKIILRGSNTWEQEGFVNKPNKIDRTRTELIQYRPTSGYEEMRSGVVTVNSCDDFEMTGFVIDVERVPFTLVTADKKKNDGALVFRTDAATYPPVAGLTDQLYAIMKYDTAKQRPGDAEFYATETWREFEWNLVGDRYEVTMQNPEQKFDDLFQAGEDYLIRHVSMRHTLKYLDVGRVKFAHVEILAGSGMGIVGNHAKHVTVSDVNVHPKENYPLSVNVDAVHLNNMRGGDVLIENCVFDGQGDDAINVPTLFYKVLGTSGLSVTLEKRDDAINPHSDNSVTSFQVKQYAFGFEAGDQVKFVNGETLEVYATRDFDSFGSDSGYGLGSTLEITLSADAPSGLSIDRGDVVYSPQQRARSVLIRNNVFKNNRARGVIAYQPNTKIIANRFEGCSGPAVLAKPDTCQFQEGPGISEFVMQCNTIVDVNYGVARADAAVHITSCVKDNEKTDRIIHNDVKITDNYFHTTSSTSTSRKLIQIEGAKTVRVERNEVSSTAGPQMPQLTSVDASKNEDTSVSYGTQGKCGTAAIPESEWFNQVSEHKVGHKGAYCVNEIPVDNCYFDGKCSEAEAASNFPVDADGNPGIPRLHHYVKTNGNLGNDMTLPALGSDSRRKALNQLYFQAYKYRLLSEGTQASYVNGSKRMGRFGAACKKAAKAYWASAGLDSEPRYGWTKYKTRFAHKNREDDAYRGQQRCLANQGTTSLRNEKQQALSLVQTQMYSCCIGDVVRRTPLLPIPEFNRLKSFRPSESKYGREYRTLPCGDSAEVCSNGGCLPEYTSTKYASVTSNSDQRSGNGLFLEAWVTQVRDLNAEQPSRNGNIRQSRSYAPTAAPEYALMIGKDDDLEMWWQICEPGRYLGTEACEQCPPGTFSPYLGMIGASTCKPCPAGTYADRAGQSRCSPCPLGKFSREKGATSCELAAAGEYVDWFGQLSSLKCPDGTYTVSIGTFSIDGCLPNPTLQPTATPTAAPTAQPTSTPTATPTAFPTAEPTATPTATPTAFPTAEPTATPTATPTAFPTAEPTATPTATPTAAPTAEPTATPTALPTAFPTSVPTASPTAFPTAAPTAFPTFQPTAEPTTTPAVTVSPAVATMAKIDDGDVSVQQSAEGSSRPSSVWFYVLTPLSVIVLIGAAAVLVVRSRRVGKEAAVKDAAPEEVIPTPGVGTCKFQMQLSDSDVDIELSDYVETISAEEEQQSLSTVSTSLSTSTSSTSTEFTSSYDQQELSSLFLSASSEHH